ncbi:uncharacterized protein [Hetaerina americana]|uniref:uncharacterized protein n=1 Tax=Hetaerina americana TaxID=62018 RepID=UPI003A7F5A0E
MVGDRWTRHVCPLSVGRLILNGIDTGRHECHGPWIYGEGTLARCDPQISRLAAREGSEPPLSEKYRDAKFSVPALLSLLLFPAQDSVNRNCPSMFYPGVIADVSNSFADLGFAGFYQDAREAPLVDYTAPYTSAGLSFLVPRPTSPAVPRWMSLVKPFNPWSWAAVGGTLAAAALTIRLLASVATRVLPPPAPAAYARYVRLPDCLLHVASVLAQVGVPMPTGNEGRWPLQWLLPGLNLITYFYSGCLAAYLTLPSPEAPIDTLSGLREAGLPWGARTSYWSLLLLHNWENPDAQVLGRRFRLISDPMDLRAGLLSAEMAAAVQTVQGSYVTNAEYLDARGFSQVHLMKETAFEGYVSILLPKGSPLTRPSDRIIGRLLAAGLVQRWERELTSSSSSPSTTSSTPPSSLSPSPSSSAPAPPSSSDSGPVVLSLEHILGAFLLLFGGLTAASATFIAEVLAARHATAAGEMF